VDFAQRWQRLKRRLEMARNAVQLVNSTGLRAALRPGVALRMARDARKGVRGSLAIIHFHAVADPLRPALVSLSLDGVETRLNYGELEARINRLTHALRRLGVGPGERVGVMVHNGHEHLEMTAALQALGGVSVQIGYRLKGPEVAYILQNAKARALVFHADLQPAVDDALKEAPLAKDQCVAIGGAPGYRSYEELLDSGDPLEPAQVPGGGVGGVMIYTSGTTGRSKGATRDFRRMGYDVVLNFIKQFPLRREDRHLVVCPLYHSAAPAFVTMVMSVGGCCVILPHFDAELVMRTIERERISSSLMVPTMYARLMALPPEVLRKHDTSSLKWLMSGAAPLPTDLARRVEDAFGPILYNFYGATETGLVTIALPGEHTARPGTIGRAISGNDIKLLGPEGHEVADGQVGEVYVKNAMMMDGYFGNQKATDDATKQGMISVGDLAWRDADGYYYLADRKTDMVISGGVNIYPWEIEQRLHEHPAVFEAAVVGVPDAEWGESLAAFVVLRQGKSCDGDELREWVRQTLADYKRPRHVVFIDSLPRNPTGKILKRELKQRAVSA
jgi:long-chain acyl-CoA synthetase